MLPRFVPYGITLAMMAWLLNACSFPTDPEAPSWNVEAYGPLVKADLNALDLIERDSLNFVFQFTAQDFGLNTAVPAPVPPFEFDQVGPETIFTAEEFFQAMEFDSTVIQILVENTLPVTINPGAQLRIDNGRSNETIILELLEEPLGANESTVISLNLTDFTLETELEISLLEVSSDGSATPVTVEPDDGVRITFQVLQFGIRRVVAVAGQSFTLEEESPFVLSGDEVDSRTLQGDFIVYADNGLPINAGIQGYILDGSRLVIDSLFAAGGQVIESAPLNDQGQPSGVTTTNDTINLTQARIDRLNDAKYFRSLARIEVPQSQAGTVEIIFPATLDFQVVGDLVVRVDGGDSE